MFRGFFLVIKRNEFFVFQNPSIDLFYFKNVKCNIKILQLILSVL